MGNTSPFMTGTSVDAANRPNGTEPLAAAAVGEQATEPVAEPVDVVISVQQDDAHMVAKMSVTPPECGGRAVTRQMLDDALRSAGIVFGIDTEALDALAAPIYGEEFTVAQGVAPQDGVDGTCVELFEREKKMNFVERNDGTVNYRELDLINDVKAGTPVCTITPPTEGVEGRTILGNPLKQRVGKKALPPAGEGTQLTSDGTQLLAAIAGNLVFRGGRFAVETTYRVENIDYDVGNITFSGNVLVNGDMQDGFEIHAGGDVTLRGRVGAAVITARNITLEKGINGTGKGALEATDTVKSGFIENATVAAGKLVTATSIINSRVDCEGDVDCTSKHGIICGGKITAFGSVRANAVGNEFNTLTVIVMGVTPRLLAERKKLLDQLADVERHLDVMSKNVAYIERLVADGRPVPTDRLQLLQRSQIQLPMTEKKRDQLISEISMLEQKMSTVNNSTLTARVIHPPTKISIGSVSTNCIETRNACRVYRNKAGELVFGTY